MASVHKNRPFPRGLSGTAGAGNYDVDLAWYPSQQGSPVTPRIMTLIVAVDSNVQFMKAGDTNPGIMASAGDTALGNTVPLKADVVYTFETIGDTLRFVSSPGAFRIVAEY